MREAYIERKTAETDIKLKLVIEGTGKSEIDTGCGFLNHMLTLFSKHGRFDLSVKCNGDTDVDYHHTVEDVGIVLGKAFSKALGDKGGICRYGNTVLPMDEALILTAADLSGRSFLNYDVVVRARKVGDLDTELVEEFLLGFVRNANITLHVKKIYGTNTHHILEGVFKSIARTLRSAVKIDDELNGETPSTKGVL